MRQQPGIRCMCMGEGWRDAALLRSGQQLYGTDGNISAIVQHEVVSRYDRVYNLEVADYHTFLIGAVGTLAHNMHANSASSARTQWIYVIRDPSGMLFKYGVTAVPARANGALPPRVQTQLSRLNKTIKGAGYTASIITEVAGGKGARATALQYERQLVSEYFDLWRGSPRSRGAGVQPPGNKLPRALPGLSKPCNL